MVCCSHSRFLHLKKSATTYVWFGIHFFSIFKIKINSKEVQLRFWAVIINCTFFSFLSHWCGFGIWVQIVFQNKVGMLCVIYRVWSSKNLYTGFQMKTFCSSKFYGKVGVISRLLFDLFLKNYILYWDFELKFWIVVFLHMSHS